MEKLFAKLNAVKPMSPELQAHLASILKSCRFKKKELILKTGSTCRHIYFIESGLIRISYWFNNKEITAWFLKEGDICIGVRSFFRQQPSHEDITALESTLAYSITYEQLEDTCRKFPEFLWHRIIFTEDYYVRSDDKHHNDRCQLGKVKYDQLMESTGELVSRVPLKHLYSYLGVTKSTFGRICEGYASGRNKKKRK